MKSIHDQLAAIQRHGASSFSETSLADSHRPVIRRVRRDRAIRGGVATLAGVGVVGAGTFGILQLRGADALGPAGGTSPSVTSSEDEQAREETQEQIDEFHEEQVPEHEQSETAPAAQVTIEAGQRAGLIMNQVAAEYQVDEARVREVIIAALPDQADGEPEGWLGVGDYGNVQTLETLTQKFTGNQTQVLTDLEIAPEDWHEVLTIASIAQAEASNTQDFAGLAAVIRNRMADGMELQVESPLQYYADINGLDPSDDGWDIDTPFNTYKYPGLPPTPINSPSQDAIAAATSPADEDWLYFAANEDTGRLMFATTFREHQENLVELGLLEPGDVL